eukprot:scaffold24392_cov57-Phaeocystis_antarctica.AAC.3
MIGVSSASSGGSRAGAEGGASSLSGCSSASVQRCSLVTHRSVRSARVTSIALPASSVRATWPFTGRSPSLGHTSTWLPAGATARSKTSSSSASPAIPAGTRASAAPKVTT